MQITQVFQIHGMHCTSCAMNIDFALEDLDGVATVHTHYAKQISTVTYDPKKITQETIISQIEKLGYQTSLIASDL